MLATLDPSAVEVPLEWAVRQLVEKGVAYHDYATSEEVAAERDARVPLRHKMGTAWDVANAALFLASDEANFITGVALLVDGGGALNIG